MKHATNLALYAYWRNRQRSDGVRARIIQAAELAPILPSIFLLGFTGHADARFSFCGSAIASRYGRDLCDETFLTLWSDADRDRLRADLRNMSARSGGMVAGIIAETFGGGFTAFEILLLPLSGDQGTAGVIGSMARVGGHDENNRIRARIVAQSLRSARILPGPREHVPRRADAVDGASRGGMGERARRYGHLTVLPGGRRLEQPGPRLTLTDI